MELQLQMVTRPTEKDEARRDLRARAWMRRWMEAEAAGVVSELGLPQGREKFFVQAALSRFVQRCTRAQVPNVCQQVIAAMDETPMPVSTSAKRCHCGGLLWNSLERNVGRCATCLSQEGHR